MGIVFMDWCCTNLKAQESVHLSSFKTYHFLKQAKHVDAKRL